MNVLHIAKTRGRKAGKTKRKKPGLSRKERKLIKQQSALLKKNKVQNAPLPAPEPESPHQEEFKLHIPEGVMQNILRIVKEFTVQRSQYGFVPIGMSDRNHCSYGLSAHHGRPCPQITEITYHEYEE